MIDSHFSSSLVEVVAVVVVVVVRMKGMSFPPFLFPMRRLEARPSPNPILVSLLEPDRDEDLERPGGEGGT